MTDDTDAAMLAELRRLHEAADAARPWTTTVDDGLVDASGMSLPQLAEEEELIAAAINAVPRLIAIVEERDAATRERNAWMEIARQHCVNEQFYQCIVSNVGDRFGVVARTSDDGSVQEDVLALKVPELVADALAERDALRRENARLRDLLQRLMDNEPVIIEEHISADLVAEVRAALAAAGEPARLL